ncbi:DUF4240 domain-containing protein [Actinoplanes sp. N902-109]|uniref:DUF4240 domain-containing protein n=1 Tax=Actinoplanes sp. (strain N902-109) TaxID=649831 RepID=UPI0005A2B823|nr:DUF4240 domain-containing protein [Actinoplanes sp. N902-109]
MGTDEFWAIAEGARSGVDDTRTGDGAAEVAARCGARLAELGGAAAVAFTLRYDLLDAQSYDWTLWGAAYLMKGGCSDDGFDYFRGWLVGQGRRVWEEVVQIPDTLADLGIDPDDDFLECEDMLNVGRAAFGNDDEAFHAAVDAARSQLPAGTFHRALVGEDVDFDDDSVMRTRYPRLAAIYSESSDI